MQLAVQCQENILSGNRLRGIDYTHTSALVIDLNHNLPVHAVQLFFVKLFHAVLPDNICLAVKRIAVCIHLILIEGIVAFRHLADISEDMREIFPFGVISQRYRINDNIGEGILILLDVGKGFIGNIRCNRHCLILLIAFQIEGIANPQCITHQLFGKTLGQTEEIPQIIQSFSGIIV